jgi:hypothetical protein
LPEVEQIRRQYEGKGIHFVALSLERDSDLVRSAARKMGIQMPVAIAKGETLGPLGASQVPSTVFIDSRGVIVAAASGKRKRSFLEARTRELLPP